MLHDSGSKINSHFIELVTNILCVRQTEDVRISRFWRNHTSYSEYNLNVYVVLVTDAYSKIKESLSPKHRICLHILLRNVRWQCDEWDETGGECQDHGMCFCVAWTTGNASVSTRHTASIFQPQNGGRSFLCIHIANRTAPHLTDCDNNVRVRNSAVPLRFEKKYSLCINTWQCDYVKKTIPTIKTSSLRTI